MELAGRCLAALGDSLAWGMDGRGGGGSQIAWPAQLGSIVHAERVKSSGVPGATIAISDSSGESFVERAAREDLSSDLILVLGGFNDFNFDVPLGASGTTDIHEFQGATRTLIACLRSRYPSTPFVLITPPPSGGVCGWRGAHEKNALGAREGDYAQAMLDIAADEGMPAIDLFASSPLDPFDRRTRARFMPDGLHYTEEGYRILASCIAEGLAAL